MNINDTNEIIINNGKGQEDLLQQYSVECLKIHAKIRKSFFMGSSLQFIKY